MPGGVPSSHDNLDVLRPGKGRGAGGGGGGLKPSHRGYEDFM